MRWKIKYQLNYISSKQGLDKKSNVQEKMGYRIKDSGQRRVRYVNCVSRKASK